MTQPWGVPPSPPPPPFGTLGLTQTREVTPPSRGMSRWLRARIALALIAGPLAGGSQLSAIADNHPIIAAATGFVMLSAVTVILTLVARRMREMPEFSERLVWWVKLGPAGFALLLAAGFAVGQS